MSLTTTEVNILRGYARGSAFADVAHTAGVREDDHDGPGRGETSTDATAGPLSPLAATAAPEPPRRDEPRPAAQALVGAAVVGEDDAEREVVAAMVGARAATTFDLASARPSPPPVAVLDQLAALVDQVFNVAYYVSVRWYCPSCHAWPLDPGACAVCTAPLQPVYLATIPRELS